MPYFYSLTSAYMNGRIRLKELQDNLKPVMKARFMHGEFDSVSGEREVAGL